MTTYTVTLKGGDQYQMRADFTEASSPIRVRYPPDEDWAGWVSTPFQVADARHYVTEAAEIITDWMGDGDEVESVVLDDADAEG